MKRLLALSLLVAVVLMNACQKETSFENGGISEGTLQSDVSDDCLPKTVSGNYVEGIALDGNTNQILVTADVTKAGTYTVYTDTVNGVYFLSTGVFPTAGATAVTLKGFGTPLGAGTFNFQVIYKGGDTCTIAIPFLPAGAGGPAAFTFATTGGNCSVTNTAGTYTVGTAVTSANTVTLSVNVTTIGTYNITTTAGGITFTASGGFTSTGVQPVVLTATSGTPTTAGANIFTVTQGASTCTFSVPVNAAANPATYTINCPSATQQGTYTVGTALTAANTVTVNVNVTVVGSYSITGSLNGMTFAATGTFASTGASVPVILTGSGTPTTSGANSIPLTGGTAGCNITVTVAAAAGPATYTINCPSATQQGTYTVNTALAAANTVTVNVNVTAVGSYSISGTLNGMTFAASGTFASTGASVPVILTGTGTPTTSGANSIPLTGGTAGCNITVTVQPAPTGNAVFTVVCTSATEDGYFLQGLPIATTGAIDIDVNVTVIGPYTITTTATNGMTFTATGTFTTTGVQTITLTGSGTPTAAGTFSIPVPGTTPCSFSVQVFPSFGTWSFREGTNNFSGVFYDRDILDTTISGIPLRIVYMGGVTAADNYFELDLIDLSVNITSGEIYNCGVFTGTANTGLMYFEAPPPGSAVLYETTLNETPPQTLTITVTNHNVATKTITGTFAGTLKDGAGVTKTITLGQFTITYP